MTDPTAAIEVWARMLCAADVHVYGADHPTWQQTGSKIRDDYRKAAAWLLPRMTVAPAGAAPATDLDALRDRIAEAARTVKLRLGPNAIAMAQRGEPIILNMGEADDLADAVLAALHEYLDIGDAEAWCKVCRRVWDGPRHRCESDAEQRLAAELDRLRTENARMRHELEVMYGGAFDALPASDNRAAVRAETLRDAEEICDEAGAVYTSKALNEHADAAYTLMERFRRKAEEAERNAAVPAGPAPATERSAVLLEAADCAYRIARRLDDQHHDQRAQGAWDVENVLRAELRRLAGEAQPPAVDPAHAPGMPCEHGCRAAADELAREAQQDPTQDGEADLPPSGAVCPDDATPCVTPGGPGCDCTYDSNKPAVTPARCPEAVWTPTPHPPHTWNQSPTHPQRPCPGVPEPDGQPETE